jgi:hypothetical protein
LNCDCVSFTHPPSCPPWLHGRYPLPRYYGDSDSCPAPSSTRTGLLDYRTCISRHSVSNHPMRPRLPAMLLVPGGLGLRFALCRYRRFFGLRSSLAVWSVASGRIEFVSRAFQARQFYGLSFRFQLLSPSRRRDAVTFNSWREAPPQWDFHPPMHAHSQAHPCSAPSPNTPSFNKPRMFSKTVRIGILRRMDEIGGNGRAAKKPKRPSATNRKRIRN